MEFLLFVIVPAVLGSLRVKWLTRDQGETYIWRWDEDLGKMVPDRPVKYCKNHPE